MTYVCDIMTSEGNDVTFRICNFDGKGTIITTSTDQWTRGPDRPDEVVRIVLGVPDGVTGNARLGNMNVSQVWVQLDYFVDEICVLGDGIVKTDFC